MRNKKSIATAKIFLLGAADLYLSPSLEILRADGISLIENENDIVDMQAISEDVPTIFLLNSNLNDADSFQLCRDLKANEFIEKVPVIFFGKSNDDAEKIKALEAGALDFISDETGEKLITAKIKSHLSSRLLQLVLEKELADKKNEEKELQRAILFYKSLTENAYDIVFSMTPDGILTYGSPNFEQSVGQPVENYLGKSVFEKLIFPKDIGVALGAIQRAYSTKEKQSNVEFRLIHKDGSLRHFKTNASPVFDEAGNMTSIVGVAKDITGEKEVTATLEVSRRSYQGLFNSINEAIYILSKEGNFVDVNEGVLNMYGYTRDEVIGNTPEFLSPASLNNLEAVKTEIARTFYRGLPGTFEIWGQRKNGEIFPNEIICSKGKYFGKPVLIVTARDISERKNAQKALNESEQKLSRIFHLSPDPILLTRLVDGKIVDANRRALEVSGYSLEEIIGKKTLELNGWLKASDRHEFISMLLEHKKVVNLEKKLLTKSGEYRVAAISGEIIEINGEQLVLTFIHDVTKHKRAEEQINEKVAQLQTLGDNLPDTMIFQIVRQKDDKMLFTYLSKGVEKIAGKSPEQVLQEPELLYNLVVDEDKKVLLKGLDQSYQDMRLLDVELRMNCFDGEVRWFKVRSAPRKLNDGRVLWDGVQMDITHKKNAEQKIQESESRWQFALDGARQGVWDWNMVTDTVFYSRNWKFMLGYREDEITNSMEEWKKRVHPEDKERAYLDVKKYINGYSGHYENEHRLLCRDGSYKWIFDIGKITERDEDGKPLRMIGTHTDISKRKLAESALQKTLEELSDYKYALDESANISITDEKGIIKHVNKNFCRQFGYSPEEVIGQSHSIIKSGHHPASFWENFWDTIKSGQVLKAEVKNIAKDGSFRWSDTTVIPFINASGEPYQYLAIRRDITEKRQLEIDLSKQLLHNQRLITELTIQEQENERSKISNELHENINQVLAGAKIYLGIAQTKSPDDNLLIKTYDYLNQAMDLINKLSSSLVAPLLRDFGLYNVLKELADEINKTKTLHVTLQNDNDALSTTDSNQMLMFYRIIQQQMDNIIKHANAKNATIHFKTSKELFYLTITDDGKGFDTTELSNGFGLLQIKNRVEFYGGNIQIKSSPGQGCSIQISIPTNT